MRERIERHRSAIVLDPLHGSVQRATERRWRMTLPQFSAMPICARCRREAPCVRVETVYGDRSICIAVCFKAWCAMATDLKLRVRELLIQHHADFFDEPTRPDIPIPSSIPPPNEAKTPKEGKGQ
jgi:hypothetical protein